MRESTIGLIFIAITVFLWSTIEVMSKFVQNDTEPLTIAFLRFLIGGIVLIPLLIRYGRRADWSLFRSKEWALLVTISFVGITGTFVLYHKALVWIDASSVATMVSMVPLFASPISIVLLKEHIGPVGIAGLIMGGAGILILNFSEGLELTSIIGVSVMVLAVFCFSLYSVLMKPLNRKMDSRVTTPMSLMIGAFFMIPFMIMENDPLIPTEISTGSWLGLLYLAVFTVGLAYLFYFLGLNHVEVSKGSSLLYLKPVTASVLAFMFIGENPTLLRSVSILIISASVYFIVKQDRIEKIITTRLDVGKRTD